MKHKSKPVARADLRERVEQKFRARGAVAFHLLVVLGVGILLLYNLPDLWASSGFDFPNFGEITMLFSILGTSGALHFIRYHFRHGRGRDRHEAETEARIIQQLQNADAAEVEEQEELIRLEMASKLKNFRLVWQHLAIFLGLAGVFFVGHAWRMSPDRILDWAVWRDTVTFFGAWGIGLLGHILRYVFTYGVTRAGREAKIEAQVERELERERRRAAERDRRVESAVPAVHVIEDTAAAETLTLEELHAFEERASR